ncbi:hypothetical protein G9A89_014653 [Geosiphon pyriformis]|nr:hypothetical protein G9A89_014653 [Geosiphon pyriformis]
MAPPNTEESQPTYRPGPIKKQNIIETPKFERDYIPPNFTIKELRQAIPAHCFKRDTLKSFSYVISDLAVIGALAYAASYIDTYLPYTLRIVAWPLYWFFCGAFATGLWVIAHECGHRAFSPSKTVNNVVGFLLHSALLVPFHSWRITHSKHHKNTAHVTKDEVFVPKTRSRVGLPPKGKDSEKHGHIFEDAPIFTLLYLIGQQLIGWPLYLTLNKSGSQRYQGKNWVNHYNPYAPIFTPDQFREIIISDIGIAMMLGVLAYFSYTFSFLHVVKYYLIPYLVVNHWLVMITFLQHTDARLPHYRDGQWDFVRGAASTVDRHYGFLDNIFHKISSTHVAHHYFSEMPHYHAEEATKHLAKLMGPYYIRDDEPIFKALWKSYNECRFIEEDGEIVFYKH